jgi:hypothetical protein
MIEASTTISKPKPAATESSSGFSDFVLRRLHVARIQAELALNQITSVGVALNAGWIGAEDALAMLSEAGLDFIIRGASSE